MTRFPLAALALAFHPGRRHGPGRRAHRKQYLHRRRAEAGHGQRRRLPGQGLANVSAAVVDRAGVLKAFVRADNAGPHTVEASRAKAFTSVSAKSPTLAMMENAQKNPGAANLTDIPGFLLLGGGVPVKAGSAVIGAIGVAGAPGGHLDAECADAALAENAALFK